MRKQILDHGYIELIEHWGSDERIIESARTSTNKGLLGWGSRCKRCRVPKEMSDMANADLARDHREYPAVCEDHHEHVWEPGDEKLLKYLTDNRHETPFEFGGIVIEVQAPIFVFREWHRHRTQCLGPDTLVHFEAPKGDRLGRRSVYKMRIEDVWKKWQLTTRKARSERQMNALFPRSRIQAMRLRCADEERREVVQTRVVDVIRGEPRPMVRITTASGKQLTATRAHRVLTSIGWITLGEAIEGRFSLACEGVARGRAERWETPIVNERSERWREIPGWPNYEVSSEGRVRRLGCEPKKPTIGANGYNVVSLSDGTTTVYTVHTLVMRAFVGPRPDGAEARHLNSNRADARLSNLEWASPKVNGADRVAADRQQRLVVSFDEIVGVEEVGELPTYDLSVEGPWHNFVADGIVVHNSFNEMSARYEPLPDVNYVPTVERLMINSKTNKQAGVIKGAEELTEENALAFLEILKTNYDGDQLLYTWALKQGVPKELARVHLPVGRYSRMRAHTCLRNWLSFMTLRKDKNAQYEIRQYANALGDIVEQCFPRTWELFSLNHPGRWDDDGLEFFEYQIALHEKKLEQLKKDYAAFKGNNT
jgi:flavin-dependent thymidylate synthase